MSNVHNVYIQRQPRGAGGGGGGGEGGGLGLGWVIRSMIL